MGGSTAGTGKSDLRSAHAADCRARVFAAHQPCERTHQVLRKTVVHTHPGSEAFYVLAEQLSQRTPYGVRSVSAGRAMPGHDAGTPMEVPRHRRDGSERAGYVRC